MQPQFCRYYHIIGRCVRRTFLCGKDLATGRDYEHRRGWIVERLETLVSAFSIEVAGYSIMSNHYHLVVRLNPGINEKWSDEEVYERWSRVYTPPQWVKDAHAGTGGDDQAGAYQTWISKRREYLGDLSWFMKCLNEPVAKRANKEDGCTGFFWEGRFRSQALMNEKALFSCLAYVDLNPIRARIAPTPEASVYTSIRQRIRAALQKPPETQLPLMPFADEVPPEDDPIPCTFDAYVQLVETTGRVLAPGKEGKIPASAESTLAQLGFNQADWIRAINSFDEKTPAALGSIEEIRTLVKAVRDTPRAWFGGFRRVAALFS
ncbi:MAG: transposase [Xanthomonadales bacterium]|nr:transposase [Xanthomonadales bacterium]